MKINIYSRERFIKYVLPNIDGMEDAFFISILEPEKDMKPFREDCDKYRTWAFYDLEENMDNGAGHIYKAITEEQAKEIYEFVKLNSDKEVCYISRSAGISRSGAIGAFINDYVGQKYNDLLKDNPRILPNGRLTRLLRMYERMDYFGENENDLIVL